MKNENKVSEMVDILDTLHKYVPLQRTTSNVPVPDSNDSEEIMVDKMHQVLFGGDQLTVVRARSAQLIRDNSQHATGRLQGFVPVIEDWHTKVCLLEVYTYIYN